MNDPLERRNSLLADLPVGARRLWVAYSGGCDSHTLLHWLASRRESFSAPLSAVHVDHGLSPDSNAWANHCRGVCDSIQVPIRILTVEARAGVRESPESAARRARYAAIAEILQPGDVVAAAHQRDDQAETLLIQLLRGSGPAGLAAMPVLVQFRNGWLWRPLLGVSRDEIRAYGNRHGLAWIDDPANQHLNLARNFIRHEIIPILKRHWPDPTAPIARAAQHCADASHLLQTLADIDLDPLVAADGSLSRPGLLRLSPARRRNALRSWLGRAGFPLPSSAILGQIERDVVTSASDRTPCVNWSDVEVRRFRDRLHAMRPLARPDPNFRALIALGGELDLPDGSVVRLTASGPIRAAALEGRHLAVGYRRGGESIKPAGQPHHRKLKHLLQEAQVPPWERHRMPILFANGEIVAVGDRWIADEYCQAGSDEGVRFTWQRSQASDSLSRT